LTLTITTSPAYREAAKHRRCLVPADWFYEWKKLDAKTKQPYAIAMKDAELFAFAGLWDSWKDEETGKALETYTVITTAPNELMEPIHNRMPVILHRQDYDRWLAVADPAQMPLDLLRPYPAKEMKAWKVSRAVGNTRNNDASLILPV
jgi:putative SOS response-associated peptidase YedK